MNDNDFQETTTRRGYVYSYYYKRPTDGKPTVLFLHGFPETHRDWSPQITYFSNKGYGIIAPDLLGYGRTSAPNDASEYKLLDMVEDIIDVLNDLKVSKVIGVAHDWGCFVLSRLLNTHIEYVTGAAFLVAGYVPPQPNFNLKAQIATLNTLLGYEVIGYWEFFGADDAPVLFEKNIDSLYSLIFPDDPSIWKEDLAPIGKAREWIEQNKQRPRATFWTEVEQEAHKAAVMQKGFRGPCNWYKSNIEELNNADDKSIPLEAYNIPIPTFFGGALKDQSSPKALEVVKTMMTQFCSNTTMRDFDSGHWVMQEIPSAVNEALDEFFATLL